VWKLSVYIFFDRCGLRGRFKKYFKFWKQLDSIHWKSGYLKAPTFIETVLVCSGMISFKQADRYISPLPKGNPQKLDSWHQQIFRIMTFWNTEFAEIFTETITLQVDIRKNMLWKNIEYGPITQRQHPNSLLPTIACR
jgi:hypothetical protein